MKKLLTKKEKLRLKILRDALKQIKVGIFKPSKGSVLFSYPLDREVLDASILNNGPIELQKILKKYRKIKGTCNVCARGALLLSTVTLENKCKIKRLDDFDLGTFNAESINDKRLLKIFSKEQLALMERAFEGDHNYDILGEELADKANDFYSLYESSYDRLIAILENAIKNKGIFKP